MRLPVLLVFGSLLLAQNSPVASNHYIRPGEDPQAVLDAAKPGDTLTFLPGLHQHPLRKHRAILYVDKPIDIDLMAGGGLRGAGGEGTALPAAHGAQAP